MGRQIETKENEVKKGKKKKKITYWNNNIFNNYNGLCNCRNNICKKII